MNISIYPEIEKLITSHITPPGYISGCKNFSNVFIFSVSGTKFCKMARRQHSHNNIYFYFDISRNVLQQRCHSPKCFGQYYTIFVPPAALMWLYEMEPWELYDK